MNGVKEGLKFFVFGSKRKGERCKNKSEYNFYIDSRNVFK